MHRKSSPQQIKETRPSQPQDPPADVMHMYASIASATSTLSSTSICLYRSKMTAWISQRPYILLNPIPSQARATIRTAVGQAATRSPEPPVRPRSGVVMS